MSDKTKSRKTDGFFGLDPHTEHYNDSDEKIGESRKVDGFFGLDPRIDHFDKSGNKTGESRRTDGFFGLDPHTEHRGMRSIYTRKADDKIKSKSKNSRSQSGAGYETGSSGQISFFRTIFLGIPILLSALVLGAYCIQTIYIGNGSAVDVLALIIEIQHSLSEYLPLSPAEVVTTEKLSHMQMFVNMIFIFGITIMMICFFAIFLLSIPLVIIYAAATSQWELFFTGLFAPVAIAIGAPFMFLGIAILWLMMLFLSSSPLVFVLGFLLGPIAFISAACYLLLIPKICLK